jgi:RNA polymerase sigma-70 factor (ECF subfamily)
LDERPGMERFEETLAPHMDAAYNLARWLTRDPHDAEDVVQEAFLRAYRFFTGFRGQDARAWLLAIVRNTGYSWLSRNRQPTTSIDEPGADDALASEAGDDSDPQAWVLRDSDRAFISAGLERLAPEFREVLVLRELEELSYKQIAQIADIPIGTVMSRLARARLQLRQELVRLRGSDA